jgi:hypothetical protein
MKAGVPTLSHRSHMPLLAAAKSAFDLQKFPPGQRDRFLNSVTRGKNQGEKHPSRSRILRSFLEH